MCFPVRYRDLDRNSQLVRWRTGGVNGSMPSLERRGVFGGHLAVLRIFLVKPLLWQAYIARAKGYVVLSSRLIKPVPHYLGSFHDKLYCTIHAETILGGRPRSVVALRPMRRRCSLPFHRKYDGQQPFLSSRSLRSAVSMFAYPHPSGGGAEGGEERPRWSGEHAVF